MGRKRRVSEKQKEKFIEFFQKQKEWDLMLKKYGDDILSSENFKRTDDFIQHGSMTVSSHCIHVAKCSLAISKKLGIDCNRRDLVRGALLHDYFLYDWHDKESGRKRLHGFYHPGIALRNASREYPLTGREKDIIRKHMWPLTVVPPRCREAWIVTTADKYCSLLETLRLKKGHGKRLPNRVQAGGIRKAPAQRPEKRARIQYQG